MLVLSWLLLRLRYRLTHVGGLALALMSVVALVWADVDDGGGGVSAGGRQRLIGDMLTLAGAFLSGVSLVGMEHAVRSDRAVEFVGVVGAFSAVITVVQM